MPIKLYLHKITLNGKSYSLYNCIFYNVWQLLFAGVLTVSTSIFTFLFLKKETILVTYYTPTMYLYSQTVRVEC